MTSTDGRKGGRSARKAHRAAQDRDRPTLAYIERLTPRIGLLDDEGLARIEETADRILDEIGMEFRGDPEVLDIFRANSCRVEGERVRFDPGFCRSTIQATAPREFIQHARNPARSVHIGGENTLFCPSFGSPFVYDLERGRRYATAQDFQDLTRIHHMLGSLHHSGGVVCEPVDVPVPLRHLTMGHAHLTLNDKPFMGAVTAPERADDTVRMCEIVFGEDFVDQNCVLYSVVNTNAPLVLDATMLGALKTYARANQAVVVSPFVLGGAMSPVSVAGTLAQILAEVMAGLALTQLIRPGAPAVFGTFFSPISLRSGAPTFGTPEGMQFQMSAQLLARRLSVPFHSVGALTASKVPDAQAGYESATQLVGAFMAGVNFIIHATGCLEGLLTMGYEKTLMDHDRCEALEVFARGVEVTDESLAFDAQLEIGPGGHFLGSEHTLRHFETAFHQSEAADNSSFEQWTAEGGEWQHDRLLRRWKEMLADYEPPPMDLSALAELDEFVARRTSEIT